MNPIIGNLKYIEISEYKNCSIIKVEDIYEYEKLILMFKPKFLHYRKLSIDNNFSIENQILLKKIDKLKKGIKNISKDLILKEIENLENFIDRKRKDTILDGIKKITDRLKPDIKNIFKGYDKDKIVEDIEKLKKNLEKTFDKKDNSNFIYQFGFFYYGAIYTLSGSNFPTFDKLLDGKINGFENYEIYKDAINKKFKTYQEYNEAKEEGFENGDLYKKYIKKGLKNKLLEIKSSEIYTKLPNFKNGFDFFNFLEKNRYHNYEEMLKSLNGKFKDGDQYRKAQKMGYQTYEDYQNGVDNGFLDGKTYKEAQSLGLPHIRTYKRYKRLVLTKNRYKFKTFCKTDIFLMIYDLKLKDKISLSKLLDNIDRRAKKYPIWYTKKIKFKKEVISFIENDKNINSLGFFDIQGEYFERVDRNKKVIIIDGSNVAWNSNSENVSPKLHNIILVAKELRKDNYDEIIVIVDAPLIEYQVSDRRLYKDLDRLTTIHRTPAKTDGDSFIIKYAKDKKCKIVTNDTFKDYCSIDNWLDKNLKEIRIPFMILDNVVKLYKEDPPPKIALNGNKTLKDQEKNDQKHEKISIETIEKVKKIVEKVGGDENRAHLAQIGKELKKSFPEFKLEIYGFKTLKALFESFSEHFDISFKMNKNTPCIKVKK